MSFGFSKLSKARLAPVHPDLRRLAETVIARSPLDFMVTEGIRSIERQRRLLAEGATRTLNSRHLTGHAIDVAVLIDGQVHWDWPLYNRLAVVFKETAAELDIPIVWGGDWKSLRDGPHFELARGRYP